ncbi:hypothetical protein Tco_0285875 [Tanacetum coccineum]
MGKISNTKIGLRPIPRPLPIINTVNDSGLIHSNLEEPANNSGLVFTLAVSSQKREVNVVSVSSSNDSRWVMSAFQIAYPRKMMDLFFCLFHHGLPVFKTSCVQCSKDISRLRSLPLPGVDFAAQQMLVFLFPDLLFVDPDLVPCEGSCSSSLAAPSRVLFNCDRS